ncbi:ABC transporter ATP-binding protein [Dictyobacter formicarum]|uniref:ABC transporter n=1 Tax=Dictyobacter formicarum TaxID=2778368 RepID=A0ABQ3VKA1_9CHLR|nr:ABC transporter ATP-binding protein [Dictyobacter formicarum]GHO86652.1 ABC transporter [Dictyobacter formicarum]
MLAKREFTVADEYRYNWSSPVRWIASHLLRYKFYVFGFMLLCIVTNALYASIPFLTGSAFNAVLNKETAISQLGMIALSLLGVIVIQGVFDLSARFFAEILSKRFARNAREELYTSLLGKSQTFHNRQQVGDVMARASNDMTQLSDMVSPAFDIIFDSFTSLTVNIIFIGLVNPQLLLVPCIYIVVFFFALRHYSRQLSPVSDRMREEFGKTNAVLNEAVAGIEVVKATAQEKQEVHKFITRASRYRDFYVQNGKIQGRYLPTLLLGVALALAFLHGLYLLSHHEISLGALITFMGLISNLRFVTFMSIWTFGLVQLGISGARRILSLMKEETEMDENAGGYHEEIRGDIVFDHVTFSYGETPILKDISFRARPGQTIAIVGQTGSGKSTLTKLVNRIYDVDSGSVKIDGVDVRQWDMDGLRSQISTIEQDVFLFSRTIAENIGYGLGSKANRAAIEVAAHDAQAHEFIQSFPRGYETEIGERGVTLSGGQRQRLAIARALLTDPRILILDDSTSAIDSATEDEIQKAIRRLLQGRTTLLITHRLSQIRWADSILVLRKGELIDQGTHEELLARCETYRRIFSHYDSAVPASVSSGD